MEPSAARLAEWVSRFVRIPSVNPLHSGVKSGAPGERAMAEAVADCASGLGAGEVVLHDVVDDRPNVYAVVPGHTDDVVVLDVHTDTVTVEHMIEDPFDGRVDDGHVWGRGALDTKASLGVMCAVLEAWRAAGVRPTPTLYLVGSIAEEAGGLLGAAAFRRWADDRSLDVRQLVVAEPTELAPVYGHKGGVGLRITVQGRSAHSATPHLGDNAIEAMAPVIAALHDEHRRLLAAGGTTELGSGTLTVTLIEGGTGGNVVPDRCWVQAGRRISPGEDPEVEFERMASLVRAACPLPVTVEPWPPPQPGLGVGSSAFHQPADSPLVRDLAVWAGTAPTTAPFGTNALRYDGFAAEKAVFGPGRITDAHRETECVRIADLVALASVYTRWLRPY
jgi:acetylornithine deacetylase/succinyl-diaminopimelate desuccinylase-like protein